MYPSRHPAAGCPVTCAAPMADMGQVRLWAYRVYLGWYRAHCGFFVLRLVPCIVPKMREGPCSPGAGTVMLWDPLTSRDGHWPGDLLAPAVCCNGLQGPGRGQCLWDTVPCDEGMWHPLVPKLGMARTSLFPLDKGVLGVLNSGKGGGPCVVFCTLPTASSTLL